MFSIRLPILFCITLQTTAQSTAHIDGFQLTPHIPLTLQISDAAKSRGSCTLFLYSNTKSGSLAVERTQSRKFEILVKVEKKWKRVYENKDDSGYEFITHFDPPYVLQYMEIKKNDTLTICEIKLVESDYCPVGMFGQHCQEDCHCNDARLCNRTEGICNSTGCEPGWKGPACNTECDSGTFGQDCSFNCHCWHNQSCLHINGSCPQDICEPGWKGDNCSIECDDGVFGRNCSFDCHCLNDQTCDHANGSCPLDMCAPGWHGDNCSSECDDGLFGQNCSLDCHCLDDQPCERTNGSCPKDICAPGWQGGNCSIECDDGVFGQNCNLDCHCLDKQPCDHTNGSCPLGICAPGWHGGNCSIECDRGRFGQNCSYLCHCLDHRSCHYINGICLLDTCAPGWQGTTCSKECDKQSFGQNCSSPCHCVEENLCHHVNGSCANGSCITGWEGYNCSIKAKHLTQQKNNVGVIIGPVVALVLFLIVIAAIILYRKRLSHDKSETTHQTFTDMAAGIKDQTHIEKKFSAKKTSRRDRQNSDKETARVTDDHMYYSFVPQVRNIEIKDFWDHINLAYRTDCQKLYQEFQKLPQGLVHECKEGRRLENAKKNRYKGMFAYDHSRVILNKGDPDESSYINACYIDGFDRPKKFIASQGPTEYMAADFWHMVIQEQSKVLVMLTNVVEHGVRKCIQYWPGEVREEQTFGYVTVRTSRITPFPDYIIREFEITTKTSRKPKLVTQAHFTAWPDKDVPDAAWHLVNFWRKVSSLVGETKSPIVIHCSAGVGRTGTYIALDNLHMQANNEGCVNPYETVLRLRQQRVNMVQTKEQYVFLHEAVAEALFIGVKSVKTNDFEAVFKSMTKPDKDKGKSGLEQQLRMVQEMWSKTEGESEYSYVSSAREIDEYKPKTSTASSSNNEDDNEVFHVQNYAGKETFILTNVSGKNLRELAKKHNIKTVIAFQNEDDREKVDKGIKQFTFREWIKGTTVPTDTQSIIALLNAVQNWQPTFDGAQPILINDTSGYKMCGIVCLLLCEFERIRLKGEVNVLSAIKQMKDGHSLLIANYEQYKFCYSAILDYIRQSDVYMNVGTTVETTAGKTKQIVED